MRSYRAQREGGDLFEAGVGDFGAAEIEALESGELRLPTTAVE
jgi:hypothetical protein